MTKQNIIINGKNVGAIGVLNSYYVYGLISNAGDSSVTDLLYFKNGNAWHYLQYNNSYYIRRLKSSQDKTIQNKLRLV